jgi:hypothetical protein
MLPPGQLKKSCKSNNPEGEKLQVDIGHGGIYIVSIDDNEEKKPDL